VDAELLVMAKATNAEMFRLERSTASALRSKNLQIPLRPHWTHLLVDEVCATSCFYFATSQHEADLNEL
jgi:hypothetical protein